MHHHPPPLTIVIQIMVVTIAACFIASALSIAYAAGHHSHALDSEVWAAAQ